MSRVGKIIFGNYFGGAERGFTMDYAALSSLLFVQQSH
jgi:hypothetical protein